MDWLSQASIEFLAALRANNDRNWFAAHKSDYETCLKYPGETFAAALASEMGERLGAPHDYRIFRIHRDVRFSKDKTPFNPHLHISLSAGGACRDGGPVWMFGLDPDGVTLGTGVFAFTPKQLDDWRGRCAGQSGLATAAFLLSLEADGVRLSKPELKRVPSPFSASHPAGELLRRKGLTAWIDVQDGAACFGPDGPSHCVDELMRLRQLFEMLTALG